MNSNRTTIAICAAALVLGCGVTAHAAFSVNAGGTAPAVGQGPLGADANYVSYGTAHETPASGALVNYGGVSFAEGGLAGPYNVGVAFSWPDANNLFVTGSNDEHDTKQSFNRANLGAYNVFWQTWVGVDSRIANGGINGADRLTLSLTGLPANTDFLFTSFHFDTQDQAGSFTVDQTLNAGETATSPFAFPKAVTAAVVNPNLTPWIDNAYTFDVTSDGTGNLDITYTRSAGTWFGINGFDVAAVPVVVPEPSALSLLGIGAIALAGRRFRKS